jgi:hypothetical protein
MIIFLLVLPVSLSKAHPAITVSLFCKTISQAPLRDIGFSLKKLGTIKYIKPKIKTTPRAL